MPSKKWLFGRVIIVSVAAVAFLGLPGLASAQTAVKESTAGGAGTAEQRAARAYEAVRANPLELEAFLWRMPKGSDLHYHFPGGIYAETWIRDAAEDGMCVDLATHAFVKPQPACGARSRCASKVREKPGAPTIATVRKFMPRRRTLRSATCTRHLVTMMSAPEISVE